jgi:hypothetical protein
MLRLGYAPGTSVPHELPDTKYIKAEVVWEAVPQTGWNQCSAFAQPPLHRRGFFDPDPSTGSGQDYGIRGIREGLGIQLRSKN